MKNRTYFASPARSSEEDINLSHTLLDSERVFLDAFGALSGIVAILDNNRQIVYANSEFLNLLGMTSLVPLLGRRLGEAVGCIHQSDNMNGCGTSEACAVCGAVNSIVKSQETGQKTTMETRITLENEGKLHSWDLKVTTTPVKIKERLFYAFTLQDISNDKRSLALERIFFHDLLNSAGGINGLIRLLKDEQAPEKAREIIDLSVEASQDLIDEIMIHRQLKAAENGDLIVDLMQVNSYVILKSAVGKIAGHEVARGKQIIIDEYSSCDDLETDRILLQRILINMLKNAIEATPTGGIVNAGIRSFGNNITFFVKSDTFIPKEIQLQIFQRSFTTKGSGRGIGTYSIRLLTENYLNGKAGFTSSETEGTVFFVDLLKSKNN
jgi:nitrogen-specific signal transduction histidine kinase